MNTLRVDQTLFISDLHLSPSRPDITSLFLNFLKQRANGVKALYILGDLFDYWVGDDDPTPPRNKILDGLLNLVTSGTEVHLLQGNRDFLLAHHFANKCGAQLLTDCVVINCHGIPTLLMHGDLLCTDDIAYQRFRELSRSNDWQSNVLSKPLWLRLALVRWYRIRSFFHKRQQSSDIMDVNIGTVWEYARKYNVLQIIHGHTHRPGSTRMDNNHQRLNRYVLGDWGKSAKIVCSDPNGLIYETISMDKDGQLECLKMKELVHQ